eukprot:CAMPEP_0119142828 /NCGR_PEP_ID=MMETSP1310-20130426/33364_1 /TAXON_ID=464262 /ORGANISM="Genus nov. species nov., Strain RCC2339" /LENGTH=110 /DNA_ID=CAMNT_0007134401 /DNA_START=301 /DNA_END=630 /DNA_ORIENTATION=+
MAQFGMDGFVKVQFSWDIPELGTLRQKLEDEASTAGFSFTYKGERLSWNESTGVYRAVVGTVQDLYTERDYCDRFVEVCPDGTLVDLGHFRNHDEGPVGFVSTKSTYRNW